MPDRKETKYTPPPRTTQFHSEMRVVCSYVCRGQRQPTQRQYSTNKTVHWGVVAQRTKTRCIALSRSNTLNILKFKNKTDAQTTATSKLQNLHILQPCPHKFAGRTGHNRAQNKYTHTASLPYTIINIWLNISTHKTDRGWQAIAITP